MKTDKIEFNGAAILRVNYKNEREKSYFLVLNGRLKAAGYSGNIPDPEIKDFAAPISKEQYLGLMDRLQTSKAESPVIRISGNLEVKVGAESLA